MFHPFMFCSGLGYFLVGIVVGFFPQKTPPKIRSSTAYRDNAESLFAALEAKDAEHHAALRAKDEEIEKEKQAHAKTKRLLRGNALSMAGCVLLGIVMCLPFTLLGALDVLCHSDGEPTIHVTSQAPDASPENVVDATASLVYQDAELTSRGLTTLVQIEICSNQCHETSYERLSLSLWDQEWFLTEMTLRQRPLVYPSLLQWRTRHSLFCFAPNFAAKE